VVKSPIYKKNVQLLLRCAGDSKLSSVFPLPINGNPDNNLESPVYLLFHGLDCSAGGGNLELP
jgi:hypothetical protein